MNDVPALPEIAMPAAEAEAVRGHYRKARTILEYGSGGSTVFAARETSATLVSIESDASWAEQLRVSLRRHGLLRDGIDIRHANIGPTKEWGMPRSHNDWRRYWRLPMGPWLDDPPLQPDLVLIDGRFRLGCFAATVINTRAPVTVLWDDYVTRKENALAEAWSPPVQVIGRMARFEITPRTLTNADFNSLLPFFFSSR